VTPEQRLQYTLELLRSIRHAEPMAPDFDPVTATSEQLELHGLPPRPDAALAPEQVARWEKRVTELKGKKFVTPTFEIIQRDEMSGSSNRSSRPEDRPEAKKWTKRNWAGAVIPQSVFYFTESTWEVPQPAAGRGNKNAWYSSAYVGLDGYQPESNDVLAGGTGHDFKKLNSSDTYAWYEWYPAYPVRLADFSVRPGNLVNCAIWSHLPRDGKAATFEIDNYSTDQWASFSFSAPLGTKSLGDSAEWVVEGEDPESNFHHVRFEECWAVKTDGYWFNLSSATTVASTCDDGTVCTAEIENDTTLLVKYQGGSAGGP
jgi:hypothetical protein